MTTYELSNSRGKGREQFNADNDAEAMGRADELVLNHGWHSAQLVRFQEKQEGFSGIQRQRDRAALVTVIRN